MMPTLAKAMSARHGFRTYYYGNFSRTGESTEPRAWYAFSAQPRVGVNYFGFRNRLCILSEAYSYLSFRRRIEVTEAFVEEILKYAATHGREIQKLTHQLDVEASQGLSESHKIGVAYKRQALPKPVEILAGEVTNVPNPRSGKNMTAMLEDKFTPVKMLDYGLFQATRAIPVGRAYLFAPEDGLNRVTEKLRAHGIAVEELTEPATLAVESFVIRKVERKERLFEGHHEVSLEGSYENRERSFAPGTLLIRTAQPLGLLAAYLLEPESEDGLVTWNFLDAYLEAGKDYPICKLVNKPKLASRLL